MLDNPDAYTEQEILDIINQDKDTREAYRLMVEAKRGNRHREDSMPVDVDAAWQRFSHKTSSGQKVFGWTKMAASVVGVVLASGLALAAINMVRQHRETEISQAASIAAEGGSQPSHFGFGLPCDTSTLQPVVYSNFPLEKMLPEIAAHYGVKVTFLNDEARGLRFRFIWNPLQGIDQVVSDLNQFEHLTVGLKDNELTIE